MNYHLEHWDNVLSERRHCTQTRTWESLQHNIAMLSPLIKAGPHLGPVIRAGSVQTRLPSDTRLRLRTWRPLPTPFSPHTSIVWCHESQIVSLQYLNAVCVVMQDIPGVTDSLCCCDDCHNVTWRHTRPMASSLRGIVSITPDTDHMRPDTLCYVSTSISTNQRPGSLPFDQ